MRLARRVLAVLLLLVALAGCDGSSRSPDPSGTLTIVASTSLTEVFTSMANGFSTAYPAVHVDVTFAPDSELARRAAAGPAPDLIVVESPATLTAAGPVSTPVHVLRGQLVLAIPADNPKGLHGLADLSRPDVRVALCEASEPCGTVTAAVLADAHVPVPPGAITAPDVRAALAHLKDGSADAALVYRSDARIAGDQVATIEFAESRTATADYVAAIPAAAPNPAAARSFLAYLTSQPTQDAMIANGFLAPA